MMKKLFYLISFTFLFFFLFIPNANAKTSADYMKDKDKYLIDTYPNFYTNLDSKFVDGLGNAIGLYFGQRTTTEFLNFNQWSHKYSNGGGIFFDGHANSLYANKENISSFIYGFELYSKYNYLANQKYEFSIILSTSEEVDGYDMYDFSKDIEFCYTAKDSMMNVCNKVAFDYAQFTFLKEGHSDSDSQAIHYRFVFQFQPNTDIEYLIIKISEPDLDVENAKYFKFIDNLTNKTIAISLAQSRFFAVDEFASYIDIVNGITFDGKRKDDSSFDDNYEVCDALDVTCHFRNLKTWFTVLGRRISNGFEAIINFFTGIGEKVINLVKSIFIPRDDFISTHFNALLKVLDEKLGFISFPFEFIGTILNRFTNLSNTVVNTINIPNIDIPPFGTIIRGTTWNISEYWQKAPFKQLYDIYLLFVHFFIAFGLYKLCERKFDEIVGGGVS